MPSFIDLTGNRFGKLVVIEFGERRRDCYDRSAIYWKCKCDCDKEKLVRASMLRVGHTKSCGCLQRQTISKLGKSWFKGYGVSAINSLYRKYKKNAKKRTYDFNLTKEQFIEFLNKNCYYCGESPKGVHKNSCMSPAFSYNGLDRMNNDLGYSLENCTPCCKRCNKAKMDLNKDQFFKMVKDIYERHLK